MNQKGAVPLLVVAGLWRLFIEESSQYEIQSIRSSYVQWAITSRTSSVKRIPRAIHNLQSLDCFIRTFIVFWAINEQLHWGLVGSPSHFCRLILHNTQRSGGHVTYLLRALLCRVYSIDYGLFGQPKNTLHKKNLVFLNFYWLQSWPMRAGPAG